MSQDQVLRLLEKSERPLSAKEISEKIGVTNANENIRRLKKYNEIKSVWLMTQTNGDPSPWEKPVLHYFV